MLFNSLEFLIFFTIVYATYLVLPGPRLQNLLLLAASYVFYGWVAPRFVVLLGFYTLLTYAVGIGIERARGPALRKAMLWVGLAINVAVLGYFKYFDFFATEVGRALTALGFQPDALTLKVFLPIGISFFTFQSIAYMVDVYRGVIPATRDLIAFAVFKAFFPQLVAGPIERAQHMMPQIEQHRLIAREDIVQGSLWVLLGFFLKAVIADRVGSLADYNFMVVDGPNRGPLAAFNGVWAFTLQIYGDFAGYTYIALGVARLMGFQLRRNFLGPYLSTSVQEFWRTWHVTLSTWLRDYLYIALGGSRNGSFRTYVNLIVTMGIGGLWHGASWVFVIWGLYHGLALAAHRALSPVFVQFPWALRQYGGWTVTILVVMVGWTIFRASSLDELLDILRRMFDLTGSVTSADLRASLMLLVFSLVVLFTQWIEERHPEKSPFVTVPIRPWQVGLAAMLLLSVLGVGFSEHRFIYFQF